MSVDTLNQRISNILAARDLPADDIERRMRERGINYKLDLVETFATPEDVCMIAECLSVPQHILLEVTHYREHFARALLKESLWSQYATRVPCSEEEAWQTIKENMHFRGQAVFNIRGQMKELLDALIPPPAGIQHGAHYPDSECTCGPKCHVTGWMNGPES